MGLFKRGPQERPVGRPVARQLALAEQLQAQALRQAAAWQQAAAGGSAGVSAAGGPAVGGSAAAGSMTWVRQVLALLAPAQPGYVKRCSCVVCGAPKKLPADTAYVYCDYCASLIDYDLRRACEGDTTSGAEYAATVNSTYAPAQAAIAAGDRDAYRALQEKVYTAYVTYVPMAVSHRARHDADYRRACVTYLVEAAVARAFDSASQALEAEMKQRVLGLRYSGNMLSPTVAPESFWPMADTLEKQIEVSRALNQSAGIVVLDPDHAEHLTGKFAWSGFCQGWLGLLAADAAAQLLDRAGLRNEYVPVQAEDGQPRHCGGCGGELSGLPGATAVICGGCGRKIDVGAAEIPCATCGASMTLPSGAEQVSCPFCQAQVRRAGIR